MSNKTILEIKENKNPFKNEEIKLMAITVRAYKDGAIDEFELAEYILRLLNGKYQIKNRYNN